MGDNVFLDATEYANTFLLLLKNELVMGRLVTGKFKNEVTDENGLTVNIKRPPMFVAQDGEALALQSVVTGSTPVTVDQYKNVHIDVGDLEYVQSFNDLMESETMKSAASELAHVIDGELHDALIEFASAVGNPANVIGSPQEFNKVHTRLMNQAVPNTSLSSVVTFDDGEEMRGALIGGNIDDINKTALLRTRIPIMSEVDIYASNNVRTITAGTRLQSAGPVLAGANQHVNYRSVKDTNSQALLVTGLGAVATVTRGDTFTIANVFATNPKSRQVLPYLKQFVVLADAVMDGAGAGSLTIAPPIIVTGTTDGVGATPTIVNTAFQTVDSIPANGAAMIFTVAPSVITTVRAAFNKRAISLVTAKLRVPFSDTSAFVSDPQTGIGIRYWRGSDITTGRHIHRWDVIFGVQNIQRELGARVSGT